MDFEALMKTIPVVATVVTLGIGFWNAGQGRKKSIADEYAARYRFYSDLKDPSMLADLKELGYQMIAGDRNLTAREVQYLLDVDPTGKALRDYIEGRTLLQCSEPSNGLEITFKKNYTKRRTRAWWQFFYFLGYLTTSVSTFLPLTLPSAGVFSAMGLDPAGAVILGCVTFLPISYLALRESRRISRAEKLIEILNSTLRQRLTLERPLHTIVTASR